MSDGRKKYAAVMGRMLMWERQLLQRKAVEERDNVKKRA
jgi:hypothetical protein